MIKKVLSVLLIVCLFAFLPSCEKKKENFSKTVVEYFDTVTTVSGYFYNEEEFNNCFKKFDKKLKRYNKLFDIYKNYDINNIKTINDNAGIKPVKVDNEIIKLLNFGKKVYDLTNGNVNICFGAVTKIWHNYREKGVSLPTKKELNFANKLTGIDNLVINEKTSTVFLKKHGCSLDVGAIAKGFICDELKQFAIKNSFENGIINLGGNVTVIGKKDGKDFTVGVRNPDDTSKNIYTLKIQNKSVVTSGDYERFYEVSGKKYCHIISPKTLFSADNNKSVTVVCDNSALADALSTALFIMDYSDGLKLIDSIDNCEALIIDKNSKSHFSSGFKGLIK